MSGSEQQSRDSRCYKRISCFFHVDLDWLTWVRVNTIGVDGLRGGLPVALRREGTESVDPDRGGYAGHGCGRNARGCAGACKWIQSHYGNCRVQLHMLK